MVAAESTAFGPLDKVVILWDEGATTLTSECGNYSRGTGRGHDCLRRPRVGSQCGGCTPIQGGACSSAHDAGAAHLGWGRRGRPGPRSTPRNARGARGPRSDEPLDTAWVGRVGDDTRTRARVEVRTPVDTRVLVSSDLPTSVLRRPRLGGIRIVMTLIPEV